MRRGLQVGVIRPWAQYGLPLDERALPQALREAGYAEDQTESGGFQIAENLGRAAAPST